LPNQQFTSQIFFNLGAFPALRAGNRAFRGCAIAPATPLRAVSASHPYNPVARIKNAFSGLILQDLHLQTSLR
jgi:hypothetical protein